MIHGKSVIGIIPARGNSKGLPRKNITDLCGKPLIAWTIEAAKNSKYLDEIVVTTDCAEIAQTAKKFGALIPFLRPKELATDESPTIEALEHTIIFYKENFGKSFDYVAVLEPTSPLREADDIDQALEMLVNQNADSIVGICRTESSHPAFLVQKTPEGRLQYLSDEKTRASRRQELCDFYFFEGTIYISKTNILLKKRTFYHENALGYEVPKWKAPEIDDIWDFITIEAIMKFRSDKINLL